MPSHPRFKDRIFKPDDNRSKGWFSRRHKSAQPHMLAQREREDKEQERLFTMAINAELRAKRTPEDQIAVLNKRLGQGQGAKKERARLAAQIEARKNAPKKRRKRKE